MLIAGIIPMSYFKIIGTLLLAQGKKGVYLGMLSASVLVNILCNMLTIPLWGKMGAAVASVVPTRWRVLCSSAITSGRTASR